MEQCLGYFVGFHEINKLRFPCVNNVSLGDKTGVDYIKFSYPTCNAVSSTGVLPTVVRRCMWSRNLVKEEALAHWGMLRQKRTNI